MVVFNVIAKCCGFYELMTALLALLLSSVEENPLQLKIIGFLHHQNISIETPHHGPLKTCGFKTFQGFDKLSLWSAGMYLPLRRMGKFWQRPSDIIDRCRSRFIWKFSLHRSLFSWWWRHKSRFQYLPQFNILLPTKGK